MWVIFINGFPFHENASWDEVEASIEALDGETVTDVILAFHDLDHINLRAIGGLRLYVMFQDPQDANYTLADPSETEAISVYSQMYDTTIEAAPACFVGKPLARHAFLHFFEHGTRLPGVEWVRG